MRNVFDDPVERTRDERDSFCCPRTAEARRPEFLLPMRRLLVLWYPRILNLQREPSLAHFGQALEKVKTDFDRGSRDAAS